MKRFLIVPLFFLLLARPALAQESFDFASLAGEWTYTQTVSGFTHTAHLILHWDGAALTGQSVYQNYKGETLHDQFQSAAYQDGKLVMNILKPRFPATLRGTLSEDGTYIRGAFTGGMSNGEFLMNRVAESGKADLSGNYMFTYQAVGGTPLIGNLQILCDNGGQLTGWLKLPDQEYHFKVEGTVGSDGAVAFSGWPKGKEMACKVMAAPDGSLAEGTWTREGMSGVFTMERR